jgi:chemotaxis protein CheD
MSRLFDEPQTLNHYFDPYFKIDSVKIVPGEYYATDHPLLIVTVVGSCVSVCIRDRVKGVGGMAHFMLPVARAAGNDAVDASLRYGAYAMEILINRLLRMGASKANLEAKVFGGSDIRTVFKNDDKAYEGGRNAEFVHLYLNAENIPIVVDDLLGIYPRKVYFFPETGKVLVKKLRNLNNDTIFLREQSYESRLRVEPVVGDVELFVTRAAPRRRERA